MTPETVEQIKENPYLQYFIGIKSYSNEAPFDASMLVHFRERISAELVNKVNQEMVSPLGGVGFRPAKVANPKGEEDARGNLF